MIHQEKNEDKQIRVMYVRSTKKKNEDKQVRVVYMYDPPQDKTKINKFESCMCAPSLVIFTRFSL